MLKKITLIGVESTGKTTLTQQLAKQYKTVGVEEFARTYIDGLDRPYNQADLLAIARGQLALEARQRIKANKYLFCDTDLIVIKVWSEFRYGICDTWILKKIKESIENQSTCLYFLCGIDVPWVYDEQREHPHLRKELHEIYKKTLEELGVNYVELIGNEEERFLKALSIIKYI